MKPHEVAQENEQLKKENAKLQEQLAGLTKRIGELEQQKPASKSRQMAVATLHLLEQGPVGIDALAKINPKYPSDAIYYVRNILKRDVKLVRKAGGNVYMLPEHFAVYTEGLKKDKAAAEASAKEAKEEIQAAQAAVSTTAGTHAAVAV
jgi:hypothetical protein